MADLTVDSADNINMSSPANSMYDVGTRIRNLELAITRLKAEGTIPVPLTSFRLLASNDTVTVASKAGGCLANNTDPTWKRESAAAGGVTRIGWASGSIVSIITDVPLPENLDTDKGLEFHIRAMRGNAATTTKAKGTLYCKFNFNNRPTASAVTQTSGAITTTTYADVVYTLTATQVPASAWALTAEVYRAAATASAADTYIESCNVQYERTLA